MKRGTRLMVILLAVGSVSLLLGWLPVTVMVVALLAVMVVRRSNYPGKRIGVRAPAPYFRKPLWLHRFQPVFEMADQTEQGDPAVRRVLETIAMLRPDGVPRWLLHPPEHEAVDYDEEGQLWGPDFAGAEVEATLDRLHEAGLVGFDGDLVTMDPKIALAIRVRVIRQGRFPETAVLTGNALYLHAVVLRLQTQMTHFGEPEADALDINEVTALVRTLLDQAVTLAWRTHYIYDRALDTILQANACLCELGHRDDAWRLGAQMASLCRLRLGPMHPVSRDAAESLQVMRAELQ